MPNRRKESGSGHAPWFHAFAHVPSLFPAQESFILANPFTIQRNCLKADSLPGISENNLARSFADTAKARACSSVFI